MNCLYKMTDLNKSSHFLLRKLYLLRAREEGISDAFLSQLKKMGDLLLNLMLRFCSLLSPSLNIDLVPFKSPLAVI